MEKKHFNGVVMEITRYGSSKDMMRKGLEGATGTKGNGDDNGIKTMLEWINLMETRIKVFERRYPAGFRGAWRG